MALFPRLKTGAVAQYPSGKRFEYSNDVLRFLDGSEQRFRQSGTPIHYWEISLEMLDETEIAAVQEFYSNHAGRFGSFEFFDPWDEAEYSNCSFEDDDLALTLDREGRGKSKFIIRRNLS